MGGDFIGSHLVQLTTGYDYLKGVIDTCMGTSKKPTTPNAESAGVLFYSADNKQLIAQLDTTADHVIEHKITGNIVEELTKSADRHGYLIYQSDKRIIFEHK